MSLEPPEKVRSLRKKLYEKAKREPNYRFYLLDDMSRGRATEALEWTRQTMGRIGLALNEAKTRIVDGHEESFDFLGYTYGPERSSGRGIKSHGLR